MTIIDNHPIVKRNLAIMWFANFFIAGSMTMVLPFISLYIETMGNFSDSYVQNWSGWIFAITFVTAFIFSPIWGRIGDKYGRKKILIFSAVGIGISILLMGFATSVWQLFLLRLFMGVATGFIPMSQAFISTQTPKHIAGRVLGTLQTGSITGTLMGPLLGGTLADTFGYANTFKWVSVTVFISGIIVLLGVKEVKTKLSDDANDYRTYTRKQVIQHIVNQPVLLVVMLISTLVQVAHFSIQPILSLFVADIHGPENIALFAGIAFSAAGLGNLLMTRKWGKIGDKIGYIKVLIFLLFMAGIVYLPGAFVTSIWQLVILRFLLGISIGGIIPLRIAYIRQKAPLSMQGEVLGYNTSLRFLGNIIGPALGGALAGFFGFSAVFVVTSALLLLSGVIMLVCWFKYEYSQNDSHSLSTHRS
ncbi:MFS transporter [Virgibacillus sp. AGTR]|uniref:MFS transporter n=1 Tax=Virgibacillus salarius TaxID=447199 RepID=A0A941I9E9_9BACI|nr:MULTISPECIES: MFS transporter [Bacillaceae]MBR7796699.1 MFS transporter [Virgibacillus salarius]MCC2252602.1 MFS transporter [Virgibacillus sp. AGTR]MDY7046566.1 MFS transporter [Virgibacillus sp. M23]QRZ18627.1 MFS transporter [Virgibacillus sp. AGTR]WBX81784.1 MFS transporter [Virgibacillus salarius]